MSTGFTYQDGDAKYATQYRFDRDAITFTVKVDKWLVSRQEQIEFTLQREFDRFTVETWLHEHHLQPSPHNMLEGAFHLGRAWADPNIKARIEQAENGGVMALPHDPLIDAAIEAGRRAKAEAEQAARDKAQQELEGNPLYGAF
jgi:hypothetical protein